MCLVRISVSRKSKVNLGLRPRTGNAKNYRVVSKIEIFGPTNPHLVKDVITKTSNIWLAFVFLEDLFESYASAFRKLSSIYVFSYFPFGFEGRIWDLIVSVPDHCLSFYFRK